MRDGVNRAIRRHEVVKSGAGAYVSVSFFGLSRPSEPVGAGAVIPRQDGLFCNFWGEWMDKERREALQVAKELTCKFIETRTVSPGNFAEVFPLIYRVVAQTIGEDKGRDASQDGGGMRDE